MPNIPSGLTQDQFILALHQLNPFYAYRFLDDGSYEWRGIENGDHYDPAPIPSDSDLQAALVAFQNAQAIAAAAIALDPPITDLSSARTQAATDKAAIVSARTDIQAAISSVHTADTAVQAASTQAQGLAAMKQLSTAIRAFVDAQGAGDLALLNTIQDLYDGETVLANLLEILKVYRG